MTASPAQARYKRIQGVEDTKWSMAVAIVIAALHVASGGAGRADSGYRRRVYRHQQSLTGLNGMDND